MATKTTARTAREADELRRQEGSHLAPERAPDARSMGAETAEYIEPTIDPQWIDAWKMFVDRDGNEYGVPVKLPRGQWDAGGPNALKNLRRPDGGFWFQLSEPESKMPEPQYECFVGDCRKRLQRRIQIVHHVRAFHYEEAEAHKVILTKIEQQVAAEDPRLQRLLAGMERPAAEFEAEPAPEEA